MLSEHHASGAVFPYQVAGEIVNKPCGCAIHRFYCTLPFTVVQITGNRSSRAVRYCHQAVIHCIAVVERTITQAITGPIAGE